MRRQNLIFILLLVVTAVTMGLVGCGDGDSPTEPDPGGEIYTVPATTNIMDETETEAIESYDSNGLLTLTESSDIASSVDIDDIIIGQDDVKAPNGFLRKVTSKTVEGGRVVLETAPAQVEEAFETLNIQEVRQLSPNDVKSSKFYRGAKLVPTKDETLFNVELDCIFYDQDQNLGTTEDQIKLVGTYAFDASIFADIQIRWFKLKKFEVGLETDKNVAIDLIAGLNWEFGKEMQFDLAEFHLGVIPLGGVVYLVPTLEIEAHVHGDMSITFETGISYTEVVRCGFGYENDEFYLINESTPEFSYTPPHFNAAFDFEAGASLNANCLLYGVAGPYVGAKSGLNFHAELDADPSVVELMFDLEAILYAVVGIECDILNFDYNKGFELYTHPIGEWRFPLQAETGTIEIDQTPNVLAGAGWSLTGPQNETGSGDATLSDMPVGEYTLTWEQVGRYVTPQASSGTLAADGTLNFFGIYSEVPPEIGTIEINQTPDDLAGAGWMLTGPEGETGSGSTVLNEMIVGNYSIVWNPVGGYITPESDQGYLSSGGTLIFEGIYVESEYPGFSFVMENDSSRYYLSDSSMTWTEGRTACESNGGHLVTIASELENQSIADVVGASKVWIGMTDEAQEGQWVWVTDEPVIYENWNPGEPNDNGGEDYALIYGSLHSNNGHWNDNSDTAAQGDGLRVMMEIDK